MCHMMFWGGGITPYLRMVFGPHHHQIFFHASRVSRVRLLATLLWIILSGLMLEWLSPTYAEVGAEVPFYSVAVDHPLKSPCRK